MRAVDPAFRDWTERAREVPLDSILGGAGIRLAGRVERYGPCPKCDGEDRFHLNLTKGIWSCRGCHPKGGDAIDLYTFLHGGNFLAACEALTGESSPKGESRALSADELARREIERAERRAAAEAASDVYRQRERKRLYRWWTGAEPAAGSPVEAYLALRRLSLPPDALLKFSPKAKLFATGKPDAEVIHIGPAMLAAIVGTGRRFAGLHVTWIDLAAPDGKALAPNPETGEFEPAKKVRGSKAGGHLALTRPKDPRRLVIGEGIETTLSVRDALIEAGKDVSGTAFWSALDLGNLGGPAAGTIPHPTERDRANRPRRVGSAEPAGDGIPLPDSVESVVLLGDGDSDAFTTTTTLARAGARWTRPGRTVLTRMAPPGTDFNTLRRLRASA